MTTNAVMTEGERILDATLRKHGFEDMAPFAFWLYTDHRSPVFGRIPAVAEMLKAARELGQS